MLNDSLWLCKGGKGGKSSAGKETTKYELNVQAGAFSSLEAFILWSSTSIDSSLCGRILMGLGVWETHCKMDKLPNFQVTSSHP